MDDAAALASDSIDETALDAAPAALVAASDADAAALPAAAVAVLAAPATVLPTPDATLPAACVAAGMPATMTTGLPLLVVVYVVGPSADGATGTTKGTVFPAALVVEIVCDPPDPPVGAGCTITAGVTGTPYGWPSASGAFVASGSADGVSAGGVLTGTIVGVDGGCVSCGGAAVP